MARAGVIRAVRAETAGQARIWVGFLQRDGRQAHLHTPTERLAAVYDGCCCCASPFMHQ
jgi:hypothetical protein